MAITEAFSGSETVTTTEWSLTTDTAGPDAVLQRLPAQPGAHDRADIVRIGDLVEHDQECALADGVQIGAGQGIADEIETLMQRCRRLADRCVMPGPRGSYPAIPWPPF